MDKKRDVYFVGDIHGNFETILWEISQRFSIRDSDFIFCGDFGVGFGSPKSMQETYKAIGPKLEKYGLMWYVVRGNHDNPDFFDGLHNLPRIIFLQDHIPLELGGKTILPIGGAVSLDRDWRILENKENEKYGSKKRIWWPGERSVKKYSGLPPKVDIVVSHEAPIDFEPVNVREDGADPDLVEDIILERNYLGWILRETRPERWFHGHYHNSTSGSYLGTLYRGLKINEIFMLRYDE